MRNAIDAHYTPAKLAELLVRSVRGCKPAVVADLAAGDGRLLAEAQKRWPGATLVATDVDELAVRRMSRRTPGWLVGRCDLRCSRSRGASEILRGVRGKVSLLLLNPPFSCRGGTRLPARLEGTTLHASAALSFLLLASSYLRKNGSIAAVLPAGSLGSRKDTDAWSYLESRFEIRVVATVPKGAFSDSAACVSLVVLTPRLESSRSTSPPPSSLVSRRLLKAHLVRGCFPMHRHGDTTRGRVLVHSTDLRAGVVHLNGRRAAGNFRTVRGAAVLVPRVGSVTRDKIALLVNDGPVVLSDCVIGLQTESLAEAKSIQGRLRNAFPKLRAAYAGTGAPYVTIERLCRALGELHIIVSRVEARVE